MLTLVAAATAGLLVAATLTDATSRADAIGPTQRVAVAAHDLAVGTRLEASDVEWRDIPVGRQPAGAFLTEADLGGDRHVRYPILRAEPIVVARLAPDGLVGVAARTPPDHHAIAVPAGDGVPPLEVGQRVDLYARRSTDASSAPSPSDRPRSSGAGPSTVTPTGTVTLATDALVVDVDDRQATLAVRDTEVGAVALALLDGPVVVTVTAR